MVHVGRKQDVSPVGGGVDDLHRPYALLPDEPRLFFGEMRDQRPNQGNNLSG